MRALVAVLTVAAFALSAASVAVSAPGQGVHGAGVSVQDPEFGSPGVERLVVNVNRLPNGELVGVVIFSRTGFGQPPTRVWARPVVLVTSADAACVVTEVTRSQHPEDLSFLVVHVENFPGTADLYNVIVAFPGDPLEQCDGLIGPGPDPRQLTHGDFKITN